MATLAGFLVGSLQALWPWKKATQPLYTHRDGRVEWLMVNVSPEGPWLVAASVALAGAGVVWGLHVLGRQTNESS